MPATDRTATPSERSVPFCPSIAARSGRIERTVRRDEGHPTLDTSDDPTGAAILWPLVMLLTYVALGVGFALAR
jgi:hypothetical protein